MLFVYGGNDPWGSEKFRLGKGGRQLRVRGAGRQPRRERRGSRRRGARERDGAHPGLGGIPAPAAQAAQPLARFDARLDTVPDEESTREHGLRP
ncbi:aminopeptidase [Streptomyces tanashiensis]